MSPFPRGSTARVGFVGNAEHAREILAEAVRGGGLHGAAVRGDKRLDGGGVESPREFLLLRLASFNHGDRQQLLVHPRVVIEDLQHLPLGLLLGRERAVALLPAMGSHDFTCQRNSRVRMNGVGCLNSHRTMFVHWFRRRGRSRWPRIQRAYAE